MEVRKFTFRKSQFLEEQSYFQKFIKGESVSVQFSVKNTKVNIIGVCDQFILKSKKNILWEKH